jgi:hypothetical protein
MQCLERSRLNQKPESFMQSTSTILVKHQNAVVDYLNVQA